MILTPPVKDMVKKLTHELESKDEDIEQQNKLNLKFSEMIESQNKKLSNSSSDLKASMSKR